MPKNLLSYRELINFFGENKVADRYKFLYDKMQEYIRVRALEEELFIHEAILQQAVMDYFIDIYRVKEFHKIDKIDYEKMLAYEIYWILRRKPIQQKPDSDSNRLVFANEGFCTTMAAHEFLMRTEGDLTAEQEEVLLEFMKTMNYHLKYRNINKQDLELMLYAYQAGRKISS